MSFPKSSVLSPLVNASRCYCDSGMSALHISSLIYLRFSLAIFTGCTHLGKTPISGSVIDFALFPYFILCSQCTPSSLTPLSLALFQFSAIFLELGYLLGLGDLLLFVFLIFFATSRLSTPYSCTVTMGPD